ncbi:unnamed protein product [Hermetia illucens]|uniref:Sodium channel protein Nach n=1 Tax=Hermetia illucens TaxID=343691 RepID=A0A7R8UNB8_HERIL|nr:unnamed protein product [Hermetia illucens]
MPFKEDSRCLRKNFLSREKRSNFWNTRVVAEKNETDAQEDSAYGIGSFLKMYLLRSSFHGVRYVVENELKLFERFIWVCIMILSIFFTVYISILLANRFNNSPLQTVIESIDYPLGNILFPAITICFSNRVDWSKIDEAAEIFIPNGTKEVKDLFQGFTSKLESFEFGNFLPFREFENVSLEPLDSINISELMEFMSYPCEDHFSDCRILYWYAKCCRDLIPQKSEFGFCHSFNTNGLNGSIYDLPLRSSLAGWEYGIDLTAIPGSPESRVPGSINPNGVKVSICIDQLFHPFAWPNSGLFIPGGHALLVKLTPLLSYATPSTRRYDPKSRGCIFADEATDSKYLKLPGFEYSRSNCLSACRQNYLVDRCNCTLEAFFPIGNYTPCKASDFKCLVKNNHFFNLETFKIDGDTANKNQSGMVCFCPPDCESLVYQAETPEWPYSE